MGYVDELGRVFKRAHKHSIVQCYFMLLCLMKNFT